jgi:aminoglycoside phosphotransferase (APT) family kinase protein
MDDARKPTLESYCADLFPEKKKAQIKNWRSIQGGWESEIIAFDLRSGSFWNREQLNLALRLYFGNSAANKAAHEFNCMRQLSKAGYPVPNVYAWAGEDSPLGRPFLLMDYIGGEPLWGLMEHASGKALQSWVQLFCGLFVQLHHLDWRLFEDDPSEDAYRFVDAWLRDARQSVSGGQQDDFKPVVDWLAQQRERMACERPAPIHQDFHPGNILIPPDGAAKVIDWTSFKVSDPRFDLAWTLILADAYIGEEFREVLLREYERQSGKPVLEMDAFEVCACARRLFDLLVSLEQGAEQRGMRPEAVEAMKRDLPAARRVYQRLVKHTGLHILRFEQLAPEE